MRRTSEHFVAPVADITDGKRARIASDPVGGDDIDTLVQATANGGRIRLYGLLSAKPTSFPVPMFGPNWKLRRSSRETSRNARFARHEELHRQSPGRWLVISFAQAVEPCKCLEGSEKIGMVAITC
jgi:NADPH:quinone reductase-like Zn-dependent oxidoreductase